MNAAAATGSEGQRTRPAQGPLATLTIMGITAVIIAGVAFLVNQPSSASGVTPVTVSGSPTGEAPRVGKPAPDFTATAVDGKRVTLSSLKGQAVWLTFGASWCQPCRAENPDIQATYEKFKATGVVVVQVYMSENAAAVADYTSRVGLTYLRVPDPDERLASEYRILGIPSHFFIDRSGLLRAMKIGSLDLPAMEATLRKIGG